jgi:hypothetical protein
MDSWRKKLWTYRERFRHADRRWHLLIGTQLLFVMGVARYRIAQERKKELAGDSPAVL